MGITENRFPCSASHCAPTRNLFRKIWGELERHPQEMVANSVFLSDRLLYVSNHRSFRPALGMCTSAGAYGTVGMPGAAANEVSGSSFLKS